jgi:hypothetical protein
MKDSHVTDDVDERPSLHNDHDAYDHARRDDVHRTRTW